ncbi:hypothetical protein [Cohnella abietis]|uniref:Lipoprotein n=1 Tax=Cohnella abietis TaxID=2507935 RepID=A0A3T1CYZ6_9BACL|nr:hypothetical protein [Cohnella abietis]BBI31083.1 hypothetical protein KCTCHS21_04820 [Cohnella abietis]
MRKHWKIMILMVTALCALMAISGCGSHSAKGTNGVKTQSYRNDGQLGTMSKNSKLPGHHIVTNYETDTVTMKQAIKKVPGVADSNVTFNGADAYVTIKLEKDLRPQQVPTVEQQAATVLRFNYPRYTIHVYSMK